MAYTRVNWEAREGTNLNKFAKSAETAASVILTNTPDAVTQEGTPLSAVNLNIMDNGIAEAHEGIETLKSSKFGACSTAAGTAAKTVSLSGFTLATGAEVTVMFTVTNTASSPTLNVNNTGAKPIYYRNAAIGAGYLAANRVYKFVYDGTQYELIGDIDTNTTYSAATASVAGLMSAGDKAKLDGGSMVTPGDIVPTAKNAAARAQARLIDLTGQLILIADYAALAANVYCGDADNAAAKAFYKCNASGTRSTSGTYMRMPDARGLSLRGAGANGTYKMANNTPYDGGPIGNVLLDMFQGHWRSDLLIDETRLYWNANFAGGNNPHITSDAATGNRFSMRGYRQDGVNGEPRIGPETRGASLSLQICLAY
jgi:hypothetical protein